MIDDVFVKFFDVVGVDRVYTLFALAFIFLFFYNFMRRWFL